MKIIARRAYRGNSLAEFGPALGILLICFFFPLLNMLTLGVAYGLGMVLNYNQSHEASLLPMNDATDPSGPVCKDIPDQWLSGMGRLVKITGYPKTEVGYRDGQTGPDKVTDRIAIVQTTLVCQPLLTIPLPGTSVPGVNAPVTFLLSSERTMENPDYAQPAAAAVAKMNTSGAAPGPGSGSGGAAGQAQTLSRGGWDGNNLSITSSGTLIVFD